MLRRFRRGLLRVLAVIGGLLLTGLFVGCALSAPTWKGPETEHFTGKKFVSPGGPKRFGDMGLVAKSSTPEEFGKFLQSEITRWSAVLTKKP